MATGWDANSLRSKVLRKGRCTLSLVDKLSKDDFLSFKRDMVDKYYDILKEFYFIDIDKKDASSFLYLLRKS